MFTDVQKIIKKLLLLSFLLLPSIAFGHTDDDATGFLSGLLHPLLGPDHLLAMFGVGMVSARIRGHYIWTIPAVFVLFMVIGGSLGAIGVGMPYVEWGIALSVIVIGAIIAIVKQSNAAWTMLIMAFVALFGSLHGHAHGVEMPGSASPIFYSLGFVTSTSTIHLLGVAFGYYPSRLTQFEKLPSYIGSTIAVAGIYIMYGLYAAV